MRTLVRTIGVVGTAAMILAGTAAAATIVGTPRNDTLRGTPKNDTISGLGGRDRLFGLAGNDVLAGGPGNDVLTGGPGADTLNCGAGADTAVAGPGDRVAADCETVQGLPQLAVADASTVEGDSGQTSLAFTVSLATAVSYNVAVHFATSNGSAEGSTDFAASEGTLQFAPGETSKTIGVAVNGDIDVEPDESLTVTLSAPQNAVLADASATGTIRNDDVPRPHTGRYSGSTSQGRSISFEVSSDWSRLANLSVHLDIRCSNGVTLADEELGYDATPITPRTWAFAINAPTSEADFVANFAFSGALKAPGSGSGTVRFDLVVNTPFGAVACTTGDVTWSAS